MLLSEMNEIKVLETGYKVEDVLGSLLCWKSLLPHCRRSSSLFVDVSLIGRILRLLLDKDLPQAQQPSQSLTADTAYLPSSLTGDSFSRHPGASQGPALGLPRPKMLALLTVFFYTFQPCD